MTERELRKLSRVDLLTMLLTLSKENEELRSQLEQTRQELESKQIVIEQSGSLAEAALRLNGIFEVAQAACDQYTENRMQICAQMEQETKLKCAALLEEAKKNAENRESDPKQE